MIRKIQSIMLVAGICFSAASTAAFADIPTAKDIDDGVQSSLKNFGTFKNTERGISIKYPKSWDKVDTPSSSPLACKFTTFKGLVSYRVATEQVPADLALNDYSQAIQGQLQKTMAAQGMPMKPLSDEETTFGGVPAKKSVYTMSMEGTPGKVQIMQVLAISKNRGYVFNYTAYDKMYEQYLPVMDEVLKSVELF